MPVSTPSRQLAIPESCTESWAAMTPRPGGRHCAACQQVVVNFTCKTDAELLAYFRQATGQPTCGRLRPDQLHRPLHPAAPVSRWRAWLASGLALGGVLGADRATAQTRNNYAGPLPQDTAVAAVTTPPLLADAPPLPARQPVATPASTEPAGRVVLRGQVLDDDCQPLPGVTVLLKGTSISTSTNTNGQFELAVDQAGPLTLTAQFIGYQSVEQRVTDPSRPLELALVATVTGLLEISVVPPAPWHPRSLYYWGKYWLTRPFHR